MTTKSYARICKITNSNMTRDIRLFSVFKSTELTEVSAENARLRREREADA